MDLGEIVWEGDWINLAEGASGELALVNVIMKLLVP
jgi:hypothetical protein